MEPFEIAGNLDRLPTIKRNLNVIFLPSKGILPYNGIFGLQKVYQLRKHSIFEMSNVLDYKQLFSNIKYLRYFYLARAMHEANHNFSGEFPPFLKDATNI